MRCVCSSEFLKRRFYIKLRQKTKDQDIGDGT